MLVLYRIVVTWNYVWKYCIKYLSLGIICITSHLKTVPQSEGAVNFIERREKKIDVRGGS